MAWKESGGGGDEPCVPAEAETLLEDTVTSSPDDQPDGRHTEETRETEEQPLIDNDSPVRQSKIAPVKISATPKMSKREKSSINSPLTSRNSSKVPVMINLDPSDRVSLNTGKTRVLNSSRASFI